MSMTENLNKVKTWQQSAFVMERQYASWSSAEIKRAQYAESCRVVAELEGNAICFCADPLIANWIAERLNLAAKLEQKYLDPEAAPNKPSLSAKE